MGFGRARKLSWMLLRNFPTTDDGQLDWSIFEEGPPDYLCEFTEALEARARKTHPKLLRAQRELGLPAFECLPECLPECLAEQLCRSKWMPKSPPQNLERKRAPSAGSAGSVRFGTVPNYSGSSSNGSVSKSSSDGSSSAGSKNLSNLIEDL